MQKPARAWLPPQIEPASRQVVRDLRLRQKSSLSPATLRPDLRRKRTDLVRRAVAGKPPAKRRRAWLENLRPVKTLDLLVAGWTSRLRGCCGCPSSSPARNTGRRAAPGRKKGQAATSGQASLRCQAGARPALALPRQKFRALRALLIDDYFVDQTRRRMGQVWICAIPPFAKNAKDGAPNLIAVFNTRWLISFPPLPGQSRSAC